MKSGKQDSFRHILKSSASIYESSSSQVFRTITGIQSTRDAFGKAMVIMTFLTILCITKILCSFKINIEEKAGKEIPSHQD